MEQDTIFINNKWLSYKEAVETVSQENYYDLLETLLEASRSGDVSDELKQAIKLLVDKMF